MPPPNPPPDPLAQWGAAIAQQLMAAMNSRSERDSAIKMHPVERRRNGKKVQEASTLPQLMAELNDNIRDLIDCIDENMDDYFDYADENKREKKGRRKGRRVKAEQDT